MDDVRGDFLGPPHGRRTVSKGAIRFYRNRIPVKFSD